MPKFVILKKCLDLFIPSIYRLRVAFSLDTLGFNFLLMIPIVDLYIKCCFPKNDIKLWFAILCFLSGSLAIKKIKLNGRRRSRFLCRYKHTVFVTMVLKGTCWCWWRSSWVFTPWWSLQCVLANSISTGLLVRVGWWVTCNFSAKSSKVSVGKIILMIFPISAFFNCFFKLALSYLSRGGVTFVESPTGPYVHVFKGRSIWSTPNAKC